MIQSNKDTRNKQKAVFNTQVFADNNQSVQSKCMLMSVVDRFFDDGETQKQENNKHRSSVVQTGLSKVPFKFKNHNPLNVVEVNIVKPPERKLDISSLLSSIPNMKHFNVSPIIPLSYPTNTLCSCSSPCPWRAKWIKWSKQPENSTLYNQLKKTPVTLKMLTQIQKDIKRTQPQSKEYRSFTNRKLLQQVLEVFSKYDKQLEYIQGMNFIASVILYHVHQAEPTFWILVDIMQRNEFREILVDGFKNRDKYTSAVNEMIRRVLPRLWKHFMKFEEMEFEINYFKWMVGLLCHLVPLQSAHLVIDRFIKDGWRSVFEIIVSYLKYLEDMLIEKNDSSDLMSFFSPSTRDQSINWHQIIMDSVNISKTK